MNQSQVWTCYFTSKKDPQRMIFTKNDSFEYIKPWYTSILKLKLYGTIFHDHCSDNFVQQYQTEKIRFIFVDPTTFNRESLNDIRFFVYQHHLQTLSAQEKPNKLFLTDISDVIIVQCPFDSVEAGILYCGSDIGCKWKEWPYLQNKILQPVRHLLCTDIVRRVENSQILNAGIIGGSLATIEDLLHRMTSLFERLPESRNLNMLVFNVVALEFTVIAGNPVTSEFKQFQTNRKDVWFIHK